MQRLMSEHGYTTELKIGVAKSGARLQAHAWLADEGGIIVGGEEAASYTLLASWPGNEALDARSFR